MFVKNIKWDITKNCFLNCSFCINKEIRSKDIKELKLNQIKKIIDMLNERKIKRIQFLGGEPLYRTDFKEIIKYIDINTNIKIGINTNGVLVNLNFIKFIQEVNCIDELYFSIDGLENTHNFIRNAKIYNLVINNIKNIKKHINKKIKIYVNTVIIKENYNEIIPLLNILNEIGVDEWIGLELIKYDKDKKKWREEINLESKLKLLNSIGKNLKKWKIEINPKFVKPLIIEYLNNKYNFKFKYPFHPCGAGLTFLYIDWKGFVYPCDRIINSSLTSKFYKENKIKEISLLNIKELNEIYNSNLFRSFKFLYADTDIYNNIIPCKQCKYINKICYPCKSIIFFNENNYQLEINCKKIIETELSKILKEVNIKEKDKYIKLNKNLYFYINKDKTYLFDFKYDYIFELKSLTKIIFNNLVNKKNLKLIELIKNSFLTYIFEEQKYSINIIFSKKAKTLIKKHIKHAINILDELKRCGAITYEKI